MVVAPSFLWSGNVRVVGLLPWPMHSAGKKHVSHAGVLLLMPFKTFKSSSSKRMVSFNVTVPPPATRMTVTRIYV